MTIDWGAVEGFAWDEGNRAKSKDKHCVAMVEAQEVFGSFPLVVLPDVVHSGTELRYHALGRTVQGRLLQVTFTVRDRQVRVISARPMSRKERSRYAEEECQA